MNRRIKALETLRRLEERELNTLSRELNAAQGAQSQALGRIETLQQRAVTEASTTATEAIPYVGRFLANLRKEQTRETKISRELEGKIEGLRSEVMQRFATEKTYDLLAQSQKAEIIAARSRAAEAALEDLTTSRFGR